MIFTKYPTATNVMVWDESEPDRHGDEVHVWFVQLGDDDGEPIGTAFKHYSEGNALITAGLYAKKYSLPIERGW